MLSLQSYGNAALKLHENGYIPIPIIFILMKIRICK